MLQLLETRQNALERQHVTPEITQLQGQLAAKMEELRELERTK